VALTRLLNAPTASIGPEAWWATDVIIVLVLMYLVSNSKVSSGLVKIGLNQLQTVTMLPVMWPNWLEGIVIVVISSTISIDITTISTRCIYTPKFSQLAILWN